MNSRWVICLLAGVMFFPPNLSGNTPAGRERPQCFLGGDIATRTNYFDSGLSQTRDVGQYAANPSFDMHGNVHEWTADWYNGYLSHRQPGGRSDHLAVALGSTTARMPVLLSVAPTFPGPFSYYNLGFQSKKASERRVKIEGGRVKWARLTLCKFLLSAILSSQIRAFLSSQRRKPVAIHRTLT